MMQRPELLLRCEFHVQRTIIIALTAAVLSASINHFLFVGICWAGLVGAIVNAIAKVIVIAQTDDISATAA